MRDVRVVVRLGAALAAVSGKSGISIESHIHTLAYLTFMHAYTVYIYAPIYTPSGQGTFMLTQYARPLYSCTRIRAEAIQIG